MVLPVLLISLGACSEDDPPTPPDTQPPEVLLVYPTRDVDDPFTVSDSVDVVVVARDQSGISSVEMYFSRPGDPARTLIGQTANSVELSDLPDSVAKAITVPDGFSLYSVRWRTATIRSGSTPQVLSVALDANGNRGVSSDLTVYVLNRGQRLEPPRVDFIISPPNGSFHDEFAFDPTGLTFDESEINTPEQIRLRWDFNGDARPSDPDESRWEVKWSDRANASQVQRYTYQGAGSYIVKAEARNTYLENETSIRQRSLIVSASVTDPAPPNPEDYLLLPAGTYRVGNADSTMLRSGLADADEYPNHAVRLNFNARVSKFEVTTALYLGYINEASQADPPLVRLVAGQIVFNDLAAPVDSADHVYVSLDDTRIFFDPDDSQFRIRAGYEQHPMTGVTFRGALAYCSHYGLRLLTESEWEVLARGDSLAWSYPYGRSLFDGDPTGQRRINYEDSGDPFEDDSSDILSGTTPVGFYDGRVASGFETIDTPSPLLPVGAYDVSGNVAEWVGDWYARYGRDQLEDPTGPLEGVFKVIRGGSHVNGPRGVRVTARAIGSVNESYPTVGFRPAYTDFEGLR